jgi:probable F420-dependent oxidoreductase
MEVGAFTFLTADSIQPAVLGRALEEAGYESLFLAEHTHIPTSRATAFPLGGELPPYYAKTYDPFVALTAVAAATSRLKLGLGICFVIQREPIVTAKAVASLDVLSGGRVVFGVGAGWNREEVENHGTSFPGRWKVLRERVEAMQVLWTQEEAEYRGDLVHVERSWSWPKPVQRPYPPVLLASHGPRTIERVLRYADGWIPSPGLAGRDLVPGVLALREAAVAAGRPRPSVTVFGADPDDAAQLQAYAGAGIDRILLRLPVAPASEVLPVVERFAPGALRYP